MGQRSLAAGAACLVTLVVVATLPDYGVTWDEVLYLEEGTAYAAWLRAPSLAGVDETWRSTHPPLHRILGGLSARLLHGSLGWLDALTAFRLATVAFVFALAYALFRFAQELFGSGVAAVVVLLFFGMPRVFFHAHIGALDVSVAAAVLCACAAYWRSFREPRWIFPAALALGVGVSLKLNAAIAIAPMGALLALRLAEGGGRPRARLLLAQWPLLVVPPLLFVAVWPWLWSAPVGRTLDLVRFHAEHFPIPTYYLGRRFAESPFHYPFVMTALTVPLPTLALAGAGLLRFARRAERVTLAFLLVGAAAPLAALALPGIPKSGGVRHFVVAYPFLCLIAGAGLREILDRVPSPAARRALLALGAAAALLGGVPAIARMHPYQVAYFNALVGGPAGAFAKGFDLDYWGSSYRGLVDWMNRHPERVYWMPIAPRLGRFYRETGVLDPALRFGSPQDADTLVLLNRPSFFDAEAWQCLRSPRPLARAGPPGVDLARLCERRR